MAARAVPGVLDILTHETVGDQIKQSQSIYQGGYASNSFRPLGSAEIAYHGQPVALVVAETFESAREAAHRIERRVCRRIHHSRRTWPPPPLPRRP